LYLGSIVTKSTTAEQTSERLKQSRSITDGSLYAGRDL
jgi:hypothetical protein